MEKEFVTYEQALTLKKLGFDEMCFGFYRNPIVELMRCRNSEPWMGNSVVSAPLKQQVLRWFREKYNMLACVYSNASGFLYEYHDTIGGTHRFDSGFTGDCEYSGAFTTYEKAENACIDKLISIIKQQDISQGEYDNIQAGN
jgi:hypothetical protein